MDSKILYIVNTKSQDYWYYLCLAEDHNYITWNINLELRRNFRLNAKTCRVDKYFSLVYTKKIDGLEFESQPIWQGKNLSFDNNVFLVDFHENIFNSKDMIGKAKGTNIIDITQSISLEVCILFENNPKGKIGDFMIENYSPHEFIYEKILIM